MVSEEWGANSIMKTNAPGKPGIKSLGHDPACGLLWVFLRETHHVLDGGVWCLKVALDLHPCLS